MVPLVDGLSNEVFSLVSRESFDFIAPKSNKTRSKSRK
jgi:hypothetical protein